MKKPRIADLEVMIPGEWPPGADDALLRLARAAKAITSEFDSDTRNILWTGEAVVVDLRAALDAFDWGDE